MFSKIVITGGPCGGKTSALKVISEHFTKKGFRVLVVPETATELISGGISVSSLGTKAAFQKCVMELQLKKEEIFENAARSMTDEKILLICDRGAADTRAYLSGEEYEEILAVTGKTHKELSDSYEAVFHMVTAADGAADFYTTGNNRARTEEPEKAIELDKKINSAWSEHRCYRIIDNSTDFKNKVKRLIREIEKIL